MRFLRHVQLLCSARGDLLHLAAFVNLARDELCTVVSHRVCGWLCAFLVEGDDDFNLDAEEEEDDDQGSAATALAAAQRRGRRKSDV